MTPEEIEALGGPRNRHERRATEKLENEPDKLVRENSAIVADGDTPLPSGEHQDGKKKARAPPQYKLRAILPRDIEHIMRKPEVCSVSGLSAPSIDRLEEAGDFPRRVELGNGKWKPVAERRWMSCANSRGSNWCRSLRFN